VILQILWDDSLNEVSLQEHTISMRKLGLGFICTLGLFSRPQEHIRHTEHGSNGYDLVGTTAANTQGPNQVPISASRR